ncbi:MAG TPA: carboxypeptidase regulatory-like domain-containing protein [Nocardioidaceae bacterium]|nr:carboxypeptidase regulatory-like domain-containing protein [Nocardioidaceae bacterium]
MRVATETRLLDVEPGETADVIVEVTNTGDVIDGVSARVIGMSEDGVVTTEPAMLPLFPDSAGHLALSLAVPSSQPAGRHPLTVEIISHGAKLPSQYVDLELDVAARPKLRLAAQPREVRARRSGKFVLELANEGNVPLDVSVRGIEVDRSSSLQFKPESVRVPVGGVVPVLLQVRGPRMITGTEVDRAVTVEAIATRADEAALAAGQPEPLEPQSTAVHLRQRPLLSRGLLTALILAAVIGLWALVFLLGITRVFSGDPMTKSAPPSFFPASAATGEAGTGADGAGGAAGGAEGVGGAPAGAMPKDGQLPAGTGASLSGTVISQSEGKPVGRILVEAVRMTEDGPDSAASAATQADGSYTLAGLFPGEYFLRFSADGYDEVWYPGAPTQSGADPVAAQAQQNATGLDVVVTGQPATISGAIDTGTLENVTATVTARPLMSTTSVGPAARTKTGANGTYTLGNLPAPATYELTFTADGYATTTLVDTVSGGGDRLEPTVQLGAAKGVIRGTVTNGKDPIGGVTVTTTVAGKEVSVLTPTSGQVGSFVLGDLTTPATYVLTFSKPGSGTTRQVVNLEAGQSRADVKASLFDQVGSISGRVTNGDRGLGGVTVSIGGTSMDSPPTTTTLTDGQVGTFVLNRLPAPGDYTATFTLEGYAPVTVPIQLSATRPAQDLEIELSSKLGGITGTVLGPKNNPYVGAEITITDGINVWTATSSGKGGALDGGGYLMTGLPPGSYTVTARADGMRQQTALVRVVADDDPVRQNLRLEAS